MQKETIKQFRLGMFIVSGTILLILTMYYIGRNQNLFGSTVKLVAYFDNVNGLQAGNNVRYAGSEAGTVESVEVISDTAVEVVILLREKFIKFIKKDAMASIGTDGLMGNKLINIMNTPYSTEALVVDGSIIRTIKPLETEDMMRTLNTTNEYVSGIALNLKNITDKISSSRGTLWKLLTDTALSGQVDATFGELAIASQQIAAMSVELNTVVRSINTGEGLLGTLINDTILSQRLYHVVSSLNTAGEQSAQVSNELLKIVQDIEKGEGTVGLLLRDTTMSKDLQIAIYNLKQSSESLNQSMEALKKIPILRRYLEEEDKKPKRKK